MQALHMMMMQPSHTVDIRIIFTSHAHEKARIKMRAFISTVHRCIDASMPQMRDQFCKVANAVFNVTLGRIAALALARSGR